MNTWRARSSGSSSSSSPSSIVSVPPPSQRVRLIAPWASTKSTACPTVRISPPARRTSHAVGVLELLHERVQVERVGLEILLEAGLGVDRVRVDVELVGQVGLDQGEDLLAACARVIAAGRLAA